MNKPNIISVDDARINPSKISANAIQVVERLQQKGYQAYLVGGCVRDLILDLKPKDFDVATDATPEQVKRVFSRNGRIIGRRFKIVHVRFGYDVIEVATFRASPDDRERVGNHEMSESEEGRLLRDNIYGSIDEDVIRRDFTANSLYLDPVKLEVLDFLGGVDDISAKKLVSIGDATTRFREDPVRMLRVVRFAAKLGFDMESEALSIIENEGKLLSHVSPARLFEEVLKLFHGGAAHRTYEKLREYGLFKYLFPFTDQMAVLDVEGMPELALKNTDIRVLAGKPVIPAFLFACMLWDPVKADAHVLMDDGAKEKEAWRVAMNDALRDQNQYVAVPRRLAEIIMDIWTIHFKLVHRSPKTIHSILENRRFRAAYDFLLLRTRVHEVDEDISEWWTRIQEVDTQEKNDMIERLSERRSKRVQQEQNSNEPNGNSLDYPIPDDIGNKVPTINRPQERRAGAGKKKRGKKRGKKVSSGRNQGGRNQAGRSQGGRNQTSDGAPVKDTANAQDGQNAPGKTKRKRNRKAGGRGRKRGKQVARANEAPAGRSVNARPRDEYGTHNSADADIKRVKVRIKKRISVNEDGSSATKASDDSSHF
ncbi:MAG TPA: polynucleotide adenylyltransferase PcnB [Gammaproteobacteria bacterium]|nr:polynucleotide adenylyltransferase PcnB [Gammaproteobacteria bacterium]